MIDVPFCDCPNH